MDLGEPGLPRSRGGPSIASLRDYVLVSQPEPLIEVYRRTEGGGFELCEARAEGVLEVALQPIS